MLGHRRLPICHAQQLAEPLQLAPIGISQVAGIAAFELADAAPDVGLQARPRWTVGGNSMIGLSITMMNSPDSLWPGLAGRGGVLPGR